MSTLSVGLNYKAEVTKAMNMLAKHPHVLFIGQTVLYPGSVISDTLKEVPDFQKIEFPVAEELQLGACIGLGLVDDIIPVCIFPRCDFLLRACDQLSNHLDLLEELTHREWKSKVIIRTIIGAKEPMYPGVQHCRDLTETFRTLLNHIEVVKLTNANKVMSAYQNALNSAGSTLIIEKAELY